MKGVITDIHKMCCKGLIDQKLEIFELSEKESNRQVIQVRQSEQTTDIHILLQKTHHIKHAARNACRRETKTRIVNQRCAQKNIVMETQT